jgi:hypothetical protein
VEKPIAVRAAGSKRYVVAGRMKSVPYASGTMMGKMIQTLIKFGADQIMS